MLNKEQSSEIKKQLLKQVENLPQEQKEAAKQQIESMNEEQLEQFLEKNKMIQGCVFCLIEKGEIPAYKINEDAESFAVLEINPVSEGHTIVAPKEHKKIEEVPSALQLAQKTSSLLKEKLFPQDIKIETSSLQGHGIINIIPVYKDKKLERKKAEESDLEELQKKLKTEKERKIKEAEEEEKPKSKKIQDLPKAPVRIP